MTGFGTAAGTLGRPDVGLLTMTEMVDNARRIVGAIALPLIADGDTGYGNAINVVRTVHEYERTGIAAIQLEDQVMPKKCGHMTGKAVVPADEAVRKIEAAVAARHDPDFVIVARTDARATDGLDAAIERGRRFAGAGADVLFIEALLDEREIETVAETFRGTPLLFNWAEGGKTPPLPYDQIAQMGFRIIIFPIATVLASMRAMQHTLAAIKGAGTPLPVLDDLPPFNEFLGFIGLPEVQDLEQRFAAR
jgi:2-methylisocitrate lyase-like PEP mutase family enzyme